MMKTLQKGLPARKELDRIQGEITAALAKIAQLEALPLHVDEVHARIAAQVKNAAQQAVPGGWFSGYTMRDGYVPDWRAHAMKFADFIALQVYLDGEEHVVDRIIAKVKVTEKFGDLRMEERTARLGKLRGQIEALEFAEERETRRLEAEGHDVIRREDACVDVLFQEWDSTSSKAETQAAA